MTTTSPFANLHSDAGNGGVIDQARLVGGWLLEPIVETAESLANESHVDGQGRGTTEWYP